MFKKLNTNISKEKRLQINDFTFHFKELKKEELIKDNVHKTKNYKDQSINQMKQKTE